jgi:ketosteroid isomerase-like protein
MQDPTQEAQVAEVVRRFYRAFFDKDRASAEALLGQGFTFSSPRDDHIDQGEYFQRCWPNSDRIDQFSEEKLAVLGNDAFLRYSARRVADGVRFRNVENIRVEDGKIVSVDVYFGRDLG